MKAPLTPGTIVQPRWTQTSTVGGALLAMAESDSSSVPPALGAAGPAPLPGAAFPLAPPPGAGLPGNPELPVEPEPGFQPLPPPPPVAFGVVRSEDGRVALTNEALEINGQAYGWRELAGVDVQPVRWLLWFLLGGFTLAGFMLGFLQNWLRTVPAALGMAAGALLLAWGMRGTNRWRVHRPGQEAAYFAFSGAPRGWQQLAAEANYRIRQRHDEAAAAAAYWLHTTQPHLPPDALSAQPAE